MLPAVPWRARSPLRRSAAASRPQLPSRDEWRRHLGRKVSLRYRLRDDPAHPFSEAIGLVQAVEADESDTLSLKIVDRKGGIKQIAVDDVLAAKIFP